jgi:pilus assembly protein CpaB
MNRRLLTILLVAVSIAGLCTFAVFRVVGNRVEANRPMATTRVVSASRDIRLGAVIAPADVTMAEVEGAAPKGSLLKLDDALGRGAVAEIYQGEPVLESRLAARGSGGGLASTIPQGMRACAVRVDEVVGVAGFVTPGERVDVLASGMKTGVQAPMVAQAWASRTILQNIQVLSAGTDIQKDAEGKPHPVQVVNLLVTPEQAETLSLATNQLRIQLVLRNPLDTSISPVHGMAMSSILGDDPGPADAPRPMVHSRRSPRSQSWVVELITGSTRTEQKFNVPEARP